MIGTENGKTPNGATLTAMKIGMATVSREPFLFEVVGVREAMARDNPAWRKLMFTEGADSFGECV